MEAGDFDASCGQLDHEEHEIGRQPSKVQISIVKKSAAAIISQ
jgi:hypothetical protein